MTVPDHEQPDPAKEQQKEKDAAGRTVRAARDLLLSPGKILSRSPCSLRLDLQNLSRHVFVAGGSGSGKSKLLELIVRQIASERGPDGKLVAGLLFIDPHGDTVRAILSWLQCSGFPAEDVLFLAPGTDVSFALDPAWDAPADGSPLRYEQWLSATVDRLVKAMLANVAAADQEVMNRLKRWLKNVLFSCLVAHDAHNSHVGLDRALVFTDPAHPDFETLYGLVRPHLPDHVRGDMDKLAATTRARDQEAWVESTINRLRDILAAPVACLVFGQHSPPLLPREVIRQRKIVLVDLAEREGDGPSREQGNVIGRLLISLLLQAARRIPEPERTPFFLLIDEAENFVSEDLRMAFAELRKFLLSVIVAFQDLTCLRKGDLDLVGKVVSQCGIGMSFQQQNPDDVEFLARVFAYGNLDFTPLPTFATFPGPIHYLPTYSVSQSSQQSVTRSESQSSSRGDTFSEQEQSGWRIQQQVSRSLSDTQSRGQSEQTSEGQSHSRTTSTASSSGTATSSGTTASHSEGESEQTGKGRSTALDRTGRITAAGTQQSLQSGSTSSDSKGESNSNTSSQSQTRGEAEQSGGSYTQSSGASWSQSLGATLSGALGLGHSGGQSQGQSRERSESVSRGTAIGDSKGVSVTHGLVPMQSQRVVELPSGKLLVPIPDQLAKVANTLAGLADRTALVKVRNMASPFVLRIHDVLDPYAERGMIRSPAWRAADLADYLKRIHAAHPCYFIPSEAFEPGCASDPASQPGEAVEDDPMS